MQSPWLAASPQMWRSGTSSSEDGKLRTDIRAMPQFKHVQCPDGALETICMKCLLPVGTSLSEQALLTSEAEHTCKAQPAFLQGTPPNPKSAS